MGVSINRYEALCFAALTRYYDFTFEKYRNNQQDFLLSADWFRNIKLPQDEISSFLAEISATGLDLSMCFQARNKGFNDFTCFRDKPVFRLPDTSFLIDAAFLAEKAESGIFWRIHNSLPKKERLEFHQIWGAAFEKYINWLLAESVDGTINRLYPNPKFAGGQEEICDAIIVTGNCAVLIEAKGATFTAEGKYGSDVSKLKAEIDEKLVATAEQRKGVVQLAVNIEQLFDRKCPRAVDSIDLSRIEKVFPVLVTRDDIGGSLVMNMYLAERFRNSFRRKNVSTTVTALFSLSAQDLELICGYLREASVSELLEERYRNDPVLKSSFWLVPNQIVKRIGDRRCEAFRQANEEFGNMVETELFAAKEG